MWSDAARTASISVRGAANVAAQGAATQAKFQAAAGPSPYGGRQSRQRGAGGGALMNQRGAAPTGGDVAAHGTAINNVARSMGGNGSQMDTRADKTRIDQLKASSTPAAYATDRASNTIDNISARQSNATMVGDHTTPPALQKYLD